MYRFNVTDPNKGLFEIVEELLQNGVENSSRNGPVLRFSSPVAITYLDPRRRILDWDVRDANHFFHHWETMWMLAGREDVAPLKFFNSQIDQYSDDGKILRGTAYGKRWRTHFGFDQLETVIRRLNENPDDRRAVLTMWDPREMMTSTQDYACNMQVIFGSRRTDDGLYLDMTVTNRSNDLIYGSMGSNLFHFSMLHEYVAKRAELRLGSYTQFSTNLHVYTENPVARRVLEAVSNDAEVPDSPPPDLSMSDLSLPLWPDHLQFNNLIDWAAPAREEGDYIKHVARPMAEAYRIFKLGSSLGSKPSKEARLALASDVLRGVPSPLGAAGIAWLERRLS